MSTCLNQAIRLDVRLESWQGVPESTKPTSFSERDEYWQVAITRQSGPPPTFELRFIFLGNEKFVLPVPATAHADLAEVFTQGGSFLKATMPHMDREWSELRKTHPHLHSLYEQERLSRDLAGVPVSAGRPKWTSL